MLEPRNPKDHVPPTSPISETFQSARMPNKLAEALQSVAVANGRTASDEVRRALEFWTIVHATAMHVEPDARMLGPERVADVLRRLKTAATEQVGDAFPRAQPEAILAALAPPPPDSRRGVAASLQRKTSDAA